MEKAIFLVTTREMLVMYKVYCKIETEPIVMRLAGAIVYLLSSLQVSLDWPIHGKELRYQISIEIEVN